MAAIAYLMRDIDILHTEEMEAELMRAASRSGLIDMQVLSCRASTDLTRS